MDYKDKEASYRQHILLLSVIMIVVAAVVLFLPPVRRLWDVGVVRFDMMTCYLAILSMAVLVFGGRRKEKQLWGQVSAPMKAKSVWPFILSLAILCICEKWLANFITTTVLHTAEVMYDSVYDTVCRAINSVYFVIVAVWIILSESRSRSVERWNREHNQLTQDTSAE